MTLHQQIIAAAFQAKAVPLFTGLPPGLQSLGLAATASVIVGSPGPDTLIGSGADDDLWGLAGNDTLDGAGGSDAMVGGLGDDRYVVDRLGDLTIEAANEGRDQVDAYLSWTLGRHIEDLSLRGNAPLAGVGNELGNHLIGNSAANRLRGLAGDDVLEGRAGDDWLDGGGGEDRLIGGPGADIFVVRPGYGRVYIEDFGPQDRLEVHGYGDWDQRYFVSDGATALEFPDVFVLFLDTPLAAIHPGVFIWADPEGPAGGPPPGAIVGTAGPDTLNGTAQPDVIWGLGGADSLDGKAGADVLVGGGGDDVYFVEQTADQVIEYNNGGRDLVNASISWTLPDDVEILHLRGGSPIFGVGNSDDNELRGNSAGNLLRGIGGADVLDGRGGDDRLVGGAEDDHLYGGPGRDVFVYGPEDDNDTIHDLEPGDVIEVIDYNWWLSLEQVGADVVITFSPGETIRIVGSNPAAVEAAIIMREP